MNYQPLLSSVIQSLRAQLTFRTAPLTQSIQAVVNKAISAGGVRHGRIGIALAIAYEAEAHTRAQLVVDELRRSRQSWAPQQIVDAENDLRLQIAELFQSNLSAAAALTQDIGRLNVDMDDPTFVHVRKSFFDHSDQASKAAMALVYAALTEIVVGAQAALSATKPGDQPSYVNHFYAPVNAVAQGNASIGTASQQVESVTPAQLAEAVRAILASTSKVDSISPTTASAIENLKSAEAELKENKLPLARLTKSLDVLGKAEEIAIKAPDVLQHIHTLLGYLGLS